MKSESVVIVNIVDELPQISLSAVQRENRWKSGFARRLHEGAQRAHAREGVEPDKGNFHAIRG